METWFRLNLGDAMLAGQELTRIQTRFSEYRESSPNKDNLQIYSRHESESSLHCELILYLTPSCNDFASQFNASTCRKPSPDGLSPLFKANQQAGAVTADTDL